MSRQENFPISVTLITLNEEKNIERALQSLSDFEDIVVVDSGSQDRTRELAEQLGARVFSEPWMGYGAQKNKAQSYAKNDWVLNLDADEVLSEELRDEILNLVKNNFHGKKGFRIPRKTFFLNRWILHGGWYPNYLTRLANKQFARWSEPEIHEQLLVEGDVGKCASPLHHFTFEDLSDQVETNLKYAKQGSLELIRKKKSPNLLKLFFKPIGKFLETYFLKRGFLDGKAGFLISVNAAYSMFLKYAFLMEAHHEDLRS